MTILQYKQKYNVTAVQKLSQINRQKIKDR